MGILFVAHFAYEFLALFYMDQMLLNSDLVLEPDVPILVEDRRELFEA